MITKPRHEINKLTGQHRIVCGNTYGEWSAYEQIAQLGCYRACTMFYVGSLPVHTVFITKDVV